MKCPRCGYEWESRIPNPKECPRCKQRLNYVGALGIKKGGVEKVITKTWGAIAVIIVVAIGLTWYVLPKEAPPVVPPVTPRWSAIVFGAAPVKSGIENIYIMKSRAAGYGYDLSTNLSGHENIRTVITATEQEVNIPYDAKFDIVVAVKAHKDNLAYVQKENVKVEFGVTSITGTLKRDGSAISTFLENSDDADEYQFELTSDYIRLNAQKGTWDNLELTADSRFDFSARLWCWG